MGAPKRSLPPALAANVWKPGQSGNPAGHSGVYGDALKLARQAAPDAIRRLIELTQSEDERVAIVACNAILDRAFGKVKPATEDKDPEVARIEAMTIEERYKLVDEILEEGRRLRTLLSDDELKLINEG
jgi:hypothetical protein